MNMLSLLGSQGVAHRPNTVVFVVVCAVTEPKTDLRGVKQIKPASTIKDCREGLPHMAGVRVCIGCDEADAPSSDVAPITTSTSTRRGQQQDNANQFAENSERGFHESDPPWLEARMMWEGERVSRFRGIMVSVFVPG
jgi:hypothetical protein